jgi:hypothetical protein
VNLLKRVLVTTAGAALATGLMAGAANASTHDGFPGPTTTAVTFVVTPNVPGGGGPWASSQVWRAASVTFSGGLPVPPWHCGWTWGSPPIPCFAFTATLRDSGTFRTQRHALTPNQGFPYTGRRIKGTVSGSVHGTVYFGTFYATAPPSASAVPGFYFDFSGFSFLTWPKMFFPPGSTFGVRANFWSYTFSAWTRCGFQRWTANSVDHGQRFFDGNIKGCFY